MMIQTILSGSGGTEGELAKEPGGVSVVESWIPWMKIVCAERIPASTSLLRNVNLTNRNKRWVPGEEVRVLDDGFKRLFDLQNNNKKK